MSIDHDDGESEHPRIRRTTLERFNAELAVLDRPLEGDIEYYDDPPRRSPRWRIVAVVGAAGLLGSLAAFALTSRSPSSDLNAGAGGDRPRVAAVTSRPPAAAPPVGTTAESFLTGSALQPVGASDRNNEDTAERAASRSWGFGVGPSRLQPSHRVWSSWGRTTPEPAPAAKAQPHPHALLRHGRHH